MVDEKAAEQLVSGSFEMVLVRADDRLDDHVVHADGARAGERDHTLLGLSPDRIIYEEGFEDVTGLGGGLALGIRFSGLERSMGKQGHQQQNAASRQAKGGLSQKSGFHGLHARPCVSHPRWGVTLPQPHLG